MICRRHHDKWGQTVMIESLNPVLMVTWSVHCPLSAWCCIITHSALVFATILQAIVRCEQVLASHPIRSWLTNCQAVNTEMQTLPKSLLCGLISARLNWEAPKQAQWGGATARVITPWLWIMPLSLASRPSLSLPSHDETDNGLLSRSQNIL